MYNLVPSTPHELGFPEKFHRWRDNQVDAIEKSIVCDKRVVANCAPTGFGKSPSYMAQAILEGGRTCILTGTKGLQDQLVKDFKSVGLVTIKGKDNYPCNYKPEWTCKDGHAGSCAYRGTSSCPYTQAYNVARASKYVITNYKFWIAIHRYGTGLGIFDRIVLDEAHLAPDEVAESMQVQLSFREVEDILGSNFPKGSPDGDAWKEWAKKEIVLCRKAVQKKLGQIQSVKDPKPTWMKDYHHLKNMVQKLGIVALMRPKDWVWEMHDNGWQFDPIRFERYAESRLLFRIPKVILYSATLRPKTMHLMGMRDDTFQFTDWPSIFDPNRSPVYQVPTMRVDSRSGGDYTMLRIRIDQIIGPRIDLARNGIIHVTSFKYRDFLVRDSLHRKSLISHFEGAHSSTAIKRFMDRGGVLISPSVAEGYDFPDDLCRFQILTKIPFRPRSKVLDARQDADPLYGPYNAMQKLVQAAGRGTRSEVDWCENFVLDDHMFWFARRFQSLAPKAFWQRYKFANITPKPLEVT